MSKIDVFIVDRHVIFRSGVIKALSAIEDIKILGEMDNSEESVDLIEAFAPNVVLLDVDAPPLYSFALGQRIRQRSPMISLIIMSSNADEDRLFQAIKTGAAAFVDKTVNPEELIDVIRKVAHGEFPINEGLTTPGVASRIRRYFEDQALMGKDIEALVVPLSPRELEILEYVANGNSNKQIAHTLKISEQTIKNHLTSILRKLDANDRTHAVVLAMRYGWISVGAKGDLQ